MKILVTGATGYVGGRLVPVLLARGHQVRVLVRDPRRIANKPWAGDVETFVGDLLEPNSLEELGEGLDAAAYLVHSMGGGEDFEARDREAAENFAARIPPDAQVVYLGGLLPDETASAHLRSRGEVGEILRGSCRALELRAGPIIGSGSASFEMVRYLTERLPVMVAPKWIRNEVQPIAVDDVLDYLSIGLENDVTGVLEIGANRLSFKEMMTDYAAERGLKRTILPLPVLAPKLAARWVGLVTPISNRIAVPLIGGIVSTPVADTTRARELFPDIRPVEYREGVRKAIDEIERGEMRTRWTGALGGGESVELDDSEGFLSERRATRVALPPGKLYAFLTSLGGETGWLAWGWAWKIRGLIDKLAGGPGLRRGRRHPTELEVGDAVDFWRVEALEPTKLIRLRAEMRTPGRAWLEWKLIEEEGGDTRLVQTAFFAPRGLLGVLYWYLLYPIHGLVFGRMLNAIARRSERS